MRHSSLWHIALASCLASLVVISAQGQPSAQLQPTAERIQLAKGEVLRLVELLQLKPGMTVADVGAGSGAWTLVFSRWTGADGHVYATDVAEEALAVLRALVARERLSNVTVIVGAAASTNLPAACCDVILVRNVYKLLPQPDEMTRSFAASLKPGGRLAVADFPPRPNPRAPLEVPANRGPTGILPEIVEREVGALLRHVITIPNWSPEGVLPSVPAGILPPFVAIFEKAR